MGVSKKTKKHKVGIAVLASADKMMIPVWERHLNNLGFVVVALHSLHQVAHNWYLYPDLYVIDVDAINLKGVRYLYAIQNKRALESKKKMLVRDNMMVYGISKNHNRNVFPFIDQFVDCTSQIPPIEYHYQSERNCLRNLVLDL